MFDFFESLNLTLPRMEKFQSIQKKKLEKNKTNLFVFSLIEIFLFYPLELGLGINFEISKLEINFIFNTYLKEEKAFLLLENKFPILI